MWRIKDKSVYPDGLLSMGVGGVVAVMSVLSRGKMGMGDGLLILAMGSVLSVGELLALLLCGIYAGLQLCVFKKKRDEEIPFAPFLLAGYLGGMFL